MITINGTNLSAYSFTYERRRLPRLLGARQSIAEIPGGLPLVLGSVTRGVTLEVDGHVTASSHAYLLTALDGLAAALRGTQVIRFADITDREWVGVLESSSGTDAIGPAEITRSERIRLVWTLLSPYARAQTVTESTGTNPTLTLGTAPSLLNVDVQNGVGDPITSITVAVRAGSTVLRSLVWTGEVESGDLWRLTMDPTWQVLNAAANAIDGLAEASDWPIADAHEGATNLLVTIDGGESPVVTTRYRRRW